LSLIVFRSRLVLLADSSNSSRFHAVLLTQTPQHHLAKVKVEFDASRQQFVKAMTLHCAFAASSSMLSMCFALDPISGPLVSQEPVKFARLQQLDRHGKVPSLGLDRATVFVIGAWKRQIRSSVHFCGRLFTAENFMRIDGNVLLLVFSAGAALCIFTTTG